MSLPAVLCAGRVYCDLVFSGLQSCPVPGDEIYAEKLSLHTGGGAGITAHCLAKLGHPSSLCASLPASPFTSVVRDELAGTVDLEFCSVDGQSDPQITAVLTGDMDRSFVTRRAGSALPEDFVQSITNSAMTKSIRHLHIGELATLLDHPELVKLARKENWSISLDCAWDVEAMQSERALALIESVDVFLPNESEIERLAGIGLTSGTAPVTVIKKGGAGAKGFSGKEIIEVPAGDVICVDTTGAGDAFNAGFIHGWLQGWSLGDCLVCGNHSGALAVGHLGGVD